MATSVWNIMSRLVARLFILKILSVELSVTVHDVKQTTIRFLQQGNISRRFVQAT